MKRSVVQHGLSTYIVSLPRSWVTKYNISRGDDLDVSEEGSRLIVSTQKSKQLGEIEVDVTGLDRTSLVYVIRGLYKRGFDVIKINFKKQTLIHHRIQKEVSIISVIHEEINNRAIGMEMMQQRENFCVIKSLSEVSDTEFNNIVRRIFLLMIDLSEDLIKGAESKDATLLQTVEEKHNTITKFINFCLRLLNKKGHPEYSKTQIFYRIISDLDIILDIYKNTARQLLGFKIAMSPTAVRLMREIHDDFRTYYELFYSFDKSKAVFITNMRSDLLSEISQNLDKMPKKDLIIISSMVPILEIVQALSEARMSLEYGNH